ncbi:GNAT family N-acetyltransferase [Halorubrum sp. JWXQ-INN 858]|uniref:GNAT family N-acetyltransferase n=1 Tax=Halorubrum sp. JWXQ-INN 858 TaxID=2690782 RepID=UPI00135BBDE9|nr:GNAT family N-acetyltransferase [Halorubrum sp. JWXQ-INN 858]MWV64431.1 GNAT family N-acetyltransferase [Halorubrum sp. JWXQ-INN 858]
MYVRDAKNRDEAWLLDEIERMGLDEAAFRSRDYVIAVDQESGDRAGFGRLRIHKPRSDAADGSADGDRDAGEDADADGEVIELTGIGVLETWRGCGVGAHVIERLVDTAAADGFEAVYVLTDQPDYLAQFGFDPVADDALPAVLVDRLGEKRETVSDDVVGLRIDVDEFAMTDRLREAFKSATPGTDADEPDATESPEDFGIDPETATYKYDTGR